MKKILFVSNTSWSLYNFRLGLMESLRNKGFKVAFCAPFDEYTKKLEEKNFEYFKMDLDRKSKNPLKEIITIFSFYRIYKKVRPDLILQYTIKPVIYGSIAAKLNKIKFINTITGLGSAFIRKNWQTRLIEFLYKLVLNSSCKVFFQNKDDLNMFVDKRLVSKEKTILVPGSGVNVDYFSPDFCEKINKQQSNFVFLYVGRIIKDKGVEILVEAYKKVKQVYPKTELWLLGPIDIGNPTAISKEKIKEWENRGLIKYFKTVSDVRPFICQANCVVLASYREGVPRSLLEAASMGKPLITTDSVGCREVVDSRVNGFLVPVKDVDALAEAMIKMIEIGEDERTKMGKMGREKIVREFDEKKVIEKYETIIKTILVK